MNRYKPMVSAYRLSAYEHICLIAFPPMNTLIIIQPLSIHMQLF